MRAIAPVLILVVVVCACDSRRSKPPRPSDPGAVAPTSQPSSPPKTRTPLRTAPRPATPRSLPAAEAAWSVAEIRETADAWDDAAEAYQHERAECVDGCREAAYAVVLARKNAVFLDPVEPPPGDEPAELPPRMRAVVDALDEYVIVADPADPELAGFKFLAASATARWRQPDAVARLEALLREHRGDPTAEYAANMLLDLLMRAERIAELRAWVDELLADAAFLAGKDELRQTLLRLRDVIAAGSPP